MNNGPPVNESLFFLQARSFNDVCEVQKNFNAKFNTVKKLKFVVLDITLASRLLQNVNNL